MCCSALMQSSFQQRHCHVYVTKCSDMEVCMTSFWFVSCHLCRNPAAGSVRHNPARGHAAVGPLHGNYEALCRRNITGCSRGKSIDCTVGVSFGVFNYPPTNRVPHIRSPSAVCSSTHPYCTIVH